MSVQFRQRTPSDYVKITWKRKWFIVLPAIAVATRRVRVNDADRCQAFDSARCRRAAIV
jgi:hypothetical protein